jgi:hypothetical protein
MAVLVQVADPFPYACRPRQLEHLQKIDKATGALLWQLQVMALDDTGGEILTVTLDAEPKISVGEFVQLHNLVVIPWNQGDRSGVAFRAAGMTAAGKHQATAARTTAGHGRGPLQAGVAAVARRSRAGLARPGRGRRHGRLHRVQDRRHKPSCPTPSR